MDGRAVYDAIGASDACAFAGSSLKLHLICVRDRMTHGLIRKLFWVDVRDMLADGLTNEGIDRLLLHSCSNDCKNASKHGFLVHSKAFELPMIPQQRPRRRVIEMMTVPCGHPGSSKGRFNRLEHQPTTSSQHRISIHVDQQ